MRVFRIQNTKKNLCDFCGLVVPECPKEVYIEFGSGKGQDNVIACSEYNGKIGVEISIDKNTSIQKRGI